MDAETIIKNYLIENGYEGLCNFDCGCGVNGLAPCDGIQLDCVPAFKIVCDECGDEMFYPAESFVRDGKERYVKNGTILNCLGCDSKIKVVRNEEE
jgi:RNase P subunit RPR2